MYFFLSKTLVNIIVGKQLWRNFTLERSLAERRLNKAVGYFIRYLHFETSVYVLIRKILLFELCIIIDSATSRPNCFIVFMFCNCFIVLHNLHFFVC